MAFRLRKNCGNLDLVRLSGFKFKVQRLQMRVHVDTYANLRQYSPTGYGHFELTLVSDATVKSVFKALNIPGNVKTVVLVNGRHATENTRLKAGDKITLFPPIEGG
jgi:molybdopterin converting factor small subunit